jgi:hypothetical protein
MSFPDLSLQKFLPLIGLALSQDAELSRWLIRQLTENSLESWEPSYDTELWKNEHKLHLFVQRSGQGDGESLESFPAQEVRILEVDVGMEESE